jgi:hypothetical protein
MRVLQLAGAFGTVLSLFACGGENPGKDPDFMGSAGTTSTGGNGSPSGGTAGSAGSSSNAGSAGTVGGSGSGASSTSGGSSGAGATAGSGGSGGEDPIPHDVADCDGLGAVDAWQEITPPDVDPSSGVGTVSVIADPIHAGTIYVGTDKQGIWKSENCGADWVKINTGEHSDALDSGTQWELKLNPESPETLYAGSLYSSDNSLLKSTNGGVDWFSTHPSGSNVAMAVEYNFFQGMWMEPGEPDHIVVTFHANCTGDYAPSCMGESTNGGETWRLFKGPTNGWLEAAGPTVFGPTSWIVHTVGDGVWFTGDSGETWDKVDGVGGTLAQAYRATDGYTYFPSFSGMYRTEDGESWDVVDGGPVGAAIIGDGTRMFTTWSDDGSETGTRNFKFALESDPTSWTTMTPPDAIGNRGNFAYETDHHVLYAAFRQGGVWRMVTQ